LLVRVTGFGWEFYCGATFVVGGGDKYHLPRHAGNHAPMARMTLSFENQVPAPPVVPGASAKRILPWLVAVAFFMQALDTTILNTAVPAIAKALGIAPLSMKAVLSSYTLEPGGVHSHQRLDGGSFRHAPRVCVGDWDSSL
jgi:hypothetical protein